MIIKNNLVLYIIVVSISTSFSQSSNPITKISESNSPIIKLVVDNIKDYELQIIYTVIDRDENNYPKFTDYNFGVDKTVYFYPASTVKLPACILALQKLNKLNIPNVNKYTSLKIDSAFGGQTKVISDETSENALPSIAHYIKKILLVSDNDAFNRLYEFLGQQQLNEGLSQIGFQNFKLVHRLAFGYDFIGNANTNPFSFYSDSGILYEQPAQINENKIELKLSKTKRGIGFINSKDKFVNEPMDFSSKNYIALPTLHGILKRLLFPFIFEDSKRFSLATKDYKFLYKYMSTLPMEIDFPQYDSTHYDSYVKFFIFGDSKKPIPKNIRIFNKVGFAYGFITDAAYIVDFENRIEFMVSATLHVNKNKTYNDGVYEYDQIGIPFLSELGRQLYDYELKRHRMYLPDLKRFKLD